MEAAADGGARRRGVRGGGPPPRHRLRRLLRHLRAEEHEAKGDQFDDANAAAAAAAAAAGKRGGDKLAELTARDGRFGLRAVCRIQHGLGGRARRRRLRSLRAAAVGPAPVGRRARGGERGVRSSPGHALQQLAHHGQQRRQPHRPLAQPRRSVDRSPPAASPIV